MIKRKAITFKYLQKQSPLSIKNLDPAAAIIFFIYSYLLAIAGVQLLYGSYWAYLRYGGMLDYHFDLFLGVVTFGVVGLSIYVGLSMPRINDTILGFSVLVIGYGFILILAVSSLVEHDLRLGGFARLPFDFLYLVSMILITILAIVSIYTTWISYKSKNASQVHNKTSSFAVRADQTVPSDFTGPQEDKCERKLKLKKG
jgi:hypothetical protein